MSWRSAVPCSTTCYGCGPGSVTIRGRAICTPARWRCCATMAGVSRYRRWPAFAAGDRALHSSRDFGDRVRPPHHAGRRQHRARGVAALRCRGPAAAGQAIDPGIGGDAAWAISPGRREVSRRGQCPGADGSRLLDLHAEEAGLRAVPTERGLRGTGTRRSGDLSAQGAEEVRGVAPGGGLHRDARRRVAGSHPGQRACSAA